MTAEELAQQRLRALLDAFWSAGEVATSLSLSGNVAADALEKWASDRSLTVEHERLSRRAFERTGPEVTWTRVVVTLRPGVYLLVSRDDDPPAVAP